MNPPSPGPGPPGRASARLTGEPLDGARLLDSVGEQGNGAAILFLGRVRVVNEGRRVARLHYEAYGEMAEAELGRIAAEAAERFAVRGVVAEHRVGTLEVGEASVAIAVAGPHRGPCFEASRYVIEQIKQRLPVWKREEYEDGTWRWLEGKKPPESTPTGSGGRGAG